MVNAGVITTAVREHAGRRFAALGSTTSYRVPAGGMRGVDDGVFLSPSARSVFGYERNGELLLDDLEIRSVPGEPDVDPLRRCPPTPQRCRRRSTGRFSGFTPSETMSVALKRSMFLEAKDPSALLALLGLHAGPCANSTWMDHFRLLVPGRDEGMGAERLASMLLDEFSTLTATPLTMGEGR